MKVVIVISTHNGSEYIRDQIRSIREQSYASWKLLIRDDGSSDGTREILQEIAATDKRISLIDDHDSNLGASQSFSLLATKALELGADYLMFCDQDDFWEPWKIEKSLGLAQSIEHEHSKFTPVLVHTDLEVVDSTLSRIAASYLRHQHMRDAKEKALNVLLSQNYITGCTILANRALISIAQPIPVNAAMHDWWYGLCASVTGVIAFCGTPSIKYRQHEDNVLGSHGFVKMLLSLKKFPGYLSRKRQNYVNSYLQDTALRDRLAGSEYSNRREYQILDSYCAAGVKTGIHRSLLALRLGIRQQGIFRNIFYYYSLLFIKPYKT